MRNHKWYNVYHFVDESINFLWPEVIKVRRPFCTEYRILMKHEHKINMKYPNESINSIPDLQMNCYCSSYTQNMDNFQASKFRLSFKI